MLIEFHEYYLACVDRMQLHLNQLHDEIYFSTIVDKLISVSDYLDDSLMTGIIISSKLTPPC